jgi:thiol:disulfide interchange protein DsbG
MEVSMRSLIVIAALAWWSPALAASPPLCTLPAPSAIPVADNQVEPPTFAPRVQPSSPPTTSLAARAGLPDGVASIPFVQHVASAGAVVTDLGESHGMRAVAARSGDQFMLFEVTADGQAAVSGVTVELTPAQLETIASGNIMDLGVEHGLPGFFVRSGPQFQVFYATPDKERLIPGVMWDAAGKDLTRQQVAHIPGTVPTVVVGGAEPRQSSGTGAAVAALPLVQKASFGTIGLASAPQLFMLVDPQCIYSVRALQMLQPYVAGGRLQVSVVPVSVLDHEDRGQSTRSALALLSKPADRLVSTWQSGSVNDAPSPEAAERLRANMAIAQAIGLKGTPTFIWRKSDGTEGRIDGIPMNMDALVSSIGS